MNTRVSIHCYAGDARQVVETLPAHARHGCPITVLSPEDSPVMIDGVDCRVGGLRQSIGLRAVERQREHMKILLSYPEDFFLMNDADSMCISPKLPAFLYAEPSVLWSCIMYIAIPEEQAALTRKGHPFVTLHPPYFMHRSTIEALLAQPVKVESHYDGYIDHWMGEAAVNAGIVWKGYPSFYSGPISTMPNCFEDAYVAARHRGALFVHAVKAPQFWVPLLAAHEKWLDDYRGVGDHRLRAEFNTTPGFGNPPALIKVSGTTDGLIHHRPGEGPPSPPTPPTVQARRMNQLMARRPPRGVRA